MFYPISSESLSPNDLRSGITTEFVEIFDRPGATNMSHEERPSGWLGQTNENTRHALGEFERYSDCADFLRENGYIPLSECCDAAIERHAGDETTDETGNELIWLPVSQKLDEIANSDGNDALSSWLYDGRADIVADYRAGKSIEKLAMELEKDANSAGYTLIGLKNELQSIIENADEGVNE